MRRKIILMGIALLSFQWLYAQTGFDKNATQIASEMGVGWNLGNTLEAGSNSNNFTNNGGLNAETAWQDTKTTQAVIDYVKQLGFRSVRIPCAWVMGHISNATDYTIDASWMARVKEVVDDCVKDGLYVVLNQHWDGGWLENNISATGETMTKNKDILEKIWKQIATTFKDYDEHLLFAGLNEPNADNQSATNNLLEYEQVFINVVRATGGNNAKRVLIIQGPSTNIGHTCNYVKTMPTDPAGSGRLMMEVHYYDPWQFWGMTSDESWGKMFFYWGKDNHVSGSTHNPTWDCEESYMKNQLQMMKSNFVDKGVPVYIGEFGANWRNISSLSGESQDKHNASIKLHYKLLCQYALEMGMVPVVWDTNYRSQPSMTIINRKNLSIYDEYMMDGISEAMQTSGISTVMTDHLVMADDAVYNLKGMRVDADQLSHGVFIQNGRKYVK